MVRRSPWEGADNVEGGGAEGRRQKAVRRRQGAGQQKAGRWRISWKIRLTDTVVGIRTENMQRPFREFVQLETTQAQRQKGTGLGLALTKKLVEWHGGHIWAESEGEGRGTTFTILLPFSGPQG